MGWTLVAVGLAILTGYLFFTGVAKGKVTAGFIGFLLFLAWAICLLLGFAGAIPYGGGNLFLTIAGLIFWGFIAFQVFRIFIAVLDRFSGNPEERGQENKADAVDMVFCRQCQKETAAANRQCAWCSGDMHL